jgi:hypothetical protein
VWYSPPISAISTASLEREEARRVDKRLYLRVGDRVYHDVHEAWGEGRVVQVMTSIVPGGTCLVRIEFEDGQQRTFSNDLDSETCCYFFGVRRVWGADVAGVASEGRPRRRSASRLLGRS